ncbi:hypothetical protein KA107_00510 [Candidatus Pacearchaeota archaeon]|nr:hypothetical protein [Candidatus Pacearchaeota archaeon]
MLIRPKEIQIFERASRLPEQATQIAREQQSFESRGYWENYKEGLEYKLWEYGEKRYLDGAKRFKREVLGLCGFATVKTLDEICNILTKLNVAASLEEGTRLVNFLTDNEKLLEYARHPHTDWVKYLSFTKMYNYQGDWKAVEISSIKRSYKEESPKYACGWPGV